MKTYLITLIAALAITSPALAQSDETNWARQAPRLPDAYFLQPEARNVASNVLSFQLPTGGWPKNINFFREHCMRTLDVNEGTIDNSATITEIRFLMRLFQATQDSTYLHASMRGIKYLLHMQYPNGGWPQYWPRRDHYHAHITFNDNAMQNVMQLLREVAQHAAPFQHSLPDTLCTLASQAFDRGIDCILRCQIWQDGQPAVWCQQHDEVTLLPVGARSFELPGLCHHESVSILQLLMSLPHPSPAVVRAVEGAVAWLKRSRITEADGSYRWARYYNIADNRPFFCGRDGVKRYRLEEIEEERQRGYSWYGRQGDQILRHYEAWKQSVSPKSVK